MGINLKRSFLTIAIILLPAVLAGVIVWFGLSKIVVEQDKQIALLEDRVSDLSAQIKQKAAEKKAEEEEAAGSSAAKKQTTAPAAVVAPETTPESSGDSGSTPAPEPEGPAILYYFYDPGCGACMIETPIVQQVEAEGVPVSYMDVDAHPAYISQYGIKFVPTFIVNNHKQVAVFTKEELINFYNTYK